MKKITENIIQIINKPYSWLFLLPLSFVFLLIYSDSTSPLFFKQGWDSAIFKVMGLGILEGKLPYRDIFDHKGPLLFYINALGQWIIPGKTGIFILENLFLFTTLLFIVKTASLFVDKGKSYLIAILFLIGLSGLLDDGNLSEFYILPFISVSLYCCMKYFTGKSDIHPLRYSFVYGFCFASVFFIRINDAISQFGAIILGLLIFMVLKKLYRQLLPNIMMFLAGVAIVTVPILLWFIYNNALSDLIYGSYTFNTIYAGENYFVELLRAYNKLKFTLYIIVFSVVVFLLRKKESGNIYFLLILVPLAVFSLFMIGNRDYNHYFMVLLPFISLTFAYMLKEKYIYTLIFSVILLFMPQFIMHTGRSVKGVIANENGKTSYNESRKLFSCIPEDERHDIWCYNLGGMGFYTLNGVSPSNRIFCSWHFDTDPELKKRETILNHRPLWLLVNPESIYRDNYEVIENEYELIGTIEDCFDEKIELYRLEK